MSLHDTQALAVWLYKLPESGMAGWSAAISVGRGVWDSLCINILLGFWERFSSLQTWSEQRADDCDIVGALQNPRNVMPLYIDISTRLAYVACH